MKLMKKVLGIGCAAMMLTSVMVPASAETIVEQKDTLPTLTTETLQAQTLNGYVSYSYVKVAPNGNARTLVTSQKRGAHSTLAEHEVKGLRNVDQLSFQIEYKGNGVTDEYYGSEGDQMDMYYEDQDFAGTVKLVGRNRESIKNTAQVKGRIQFN